VGGAQKGPQIQGNFEVHCNLSDVENFDFWLLAISQSVLLGLM